MLQDGGNCSIAAAHFGFEVVELGDILIQINSLGWDS